VTPVGRRLGKTRAVTANALLSELTKDFSAGLWKPD